MLIMLMCVCEHFTIYKIALHTSLDVHNMWVKAGFAMTKLIIIVLLGGFMVSKMDSEIITEKNMAVKIFNNSYSYVWVYNR